MLLSSCYHPVFPPPPTQNPVWNPGMCHTWQWCTFMHALTSWQRLLRDEQTLLKEVCLSFRTTQTYILFSYPFNVLDWCKSMYREVSHILNRVFTLTGNWLGNDTSFKARGSSNCATDLNYRTSSIRRRGYRLRTISTRVSVFHSCLSHILYVGGKLQNCSDSMPLKQLIGQT